MTDRTRSLLAALVGAVVLIGGKQFIPTWYVPWILGALCAVITWLVTSPRQAS